MYRLLSLFVFLFWTSIGTNGQNFPRDTSFTLYRDYQKQLKYYPDIEPVKPLVPANVKAMRNLVYASYGERKMHIDIFQPTDLDSKQPAVLLIHGGGWASGDKSMEAPMAIELARQGYVTAAVEYRLSPEALYPAAVIDIKTAIRYLRKNADHYQIDTSKIAVYGTSAGGQLAALIGTTNASSRYFDDSHYPSFSDGVQAIIDVDGVLCFIHPESSEGLDRPGKPSAATRWFGTNKSESKLLWDEASALYHTNKNTPPVLFINSQHPRFHAGRDDMIKMLDSLNICNEVHTLPDTPHTFWLYHPWFSETVQHVNAFLEKQFRKEK